MSNANGFTLLVPCKALDAAKSRTRLRRQERIALATALVADTVTVSLQAVGVDEVVVVSPDVRIGAVALARGARWYDDGGAPDLSSALDRALSDPRLRRRGGIAILVADLPRLRAGELEDALAAARSASPTPVFVADAAGSGTTLLAGMDRTRVRPGFGPRSADRHRTRGYLPVLGDLDGLRHDVDLPEDVHGLTAAVSGPATAALISRLELAVR